MKKLAIALLAVSLSLGGCTSLASGVSSLATELSSSTPSQVSTLAAAEQAATLITKSADLYVNTGSPNRAVLLEILNLSDALHTALGALEVANSAGNSLDYAAFNAALLAYQSYATNEGISH